MKTKKVFVISIVFGLLLMSIGLASGRVMAQSANLALNKPATASSIESSTYTAAKAVDGSTTTRWASVEPTPNDEWIYLDLGASTAISQVVLKWEVAYGKSYKVETSDDAATWTQIYATTTGDGGTDDLTVSGSGRYVRVYMTERGTVYGYSLWELEVYGTGGATATNTSVAPTVTQTNPPTGTMTQPAVTFMPTRTSTRTSTATVTSTQPTGNLIYQAEAASLGGGVTIDSNHLGFLGTGFLNFPLNGGFAQFSNVDGGMGGSRTLRIRYTLGATASRTGLLIVNGASQNITFPVTATWDTWAIRQMLVTLNSGTTNTLRFESNGQDLANLDQLEVTSGATVTSTPTRTFTPSRTPTRTITPTMAIRTSTPTKTSIPSYLRLVNVSTAAQLNAALQQAQPGDLIQMADGVYQGFSFTATSSGTAAWRITLKGSRNAIIDHGGNGYGFHLQANYWTLLGFTVRNASKGIMIDSGNFDILDSLRVFHIGDEGIHFRTNSTNNVLQNSLIYDTGVNSPGYGEGVYIGSAESNWPTYTNGQPDRSDKNKVLNNTIGPNVRGENIDVKEGTSGGELRGNTFDGSGLTGQHFDDSWVDVKGNNYLIQSNTGIYSLLDGFQTHIQLAGWGCNNIFRGNNADVRATGYGFRIQLTSGSSCGNLVYTDNVVTNAGSGIANIPLAP